MSAGTLRAPASRFDEAARRRAVAAEFERQRAAAKAPPPAPKPLVVAPAGPRIGRGSRAIQTGKAFGRLRLRRLLIGGALPAVFIGEFRPLALGIKQPLLSLVQPGHYVAALAWLRGYVARVEYLEAVAADGSRRFNLDGSDAGEVSPEHRAHALGKLGRAPDAQS